jgi:hypothetical protein
MITPKVYSGDSNGSAETASIGKNNRIFTPPSEHAFGESAL